MKDRPGDEERNRNSRLQTAVAKSDVGLTGRLLGEGADPNGLVRIPFLHRAIRHESLPIVRLLVEAGADIERTNHAGWAPLTHADANEQEAIVEYLVGAGADLTTRERHGFSHVHRAVRAGDRARLSLLLRGGADVNAQSADGSTPLMHAAQTCDTDLSGSLLQILLQHRADPDLCDYEGWAPLASATYEDAAHTDFNNHPIVRVPLLLGAGAEPNAGTYPPLLAAISQEARTGQSSRPSYEPGQTLTSSMTMGQRSFCAPCRSPSTASSSPNAPPQSATSTGPPTTASDPSRRS